VVVAGAVESDRVPHSARSTISEMVGMIYPTDRTEVPTDILCRRAMAEGVVLLEALSAVEAEAAVGRAYR